MSAPFSQNNVFKRLRIEASTVKCLTHTQAMPERIKIVDQIGPNAQSGGFQKGSFKAWYHGPRSVANPPRIATDKPQASGTIIFLFNIDLNSPSAKKSLVGKRV